MAQAPADGPAGLEASSAGFEYSASYEGPSRDANEVDAYVADPWCGWPMTDNVIPT